MTFLSICNFKRDYIIQINYSQETDYELISKQLNQLDMDILLFIATFRNVQLLQISREFGLPIPKIKPHLKRLREFYLVQEWEFEREDTPGALATSYSIYSHGTMLLFLQQIRSAETSLINGKIFFGKKITTLLFDTGRS